MKKYFIAIFLFVFNIGLFAQIMNRSTDLISPTIHLSNSQTPSIIHHNLNSQAIGDTVFVFDGNNFFDWNGTLPGTFNFQTQDLDGDQVAPSLQATAFGPTSSFVFFYETDPTSPLHYNHADTVFFIGATSYFNPADTANNWLEMGPIHVPSTGGTLKWRHNYPDVNYRDGYEIRVNTTGLSANDFTNVPLKIIYDNDTTTAMDSASTPHLLFYQRAADVSAYAGQDIYIAIRHNANDMSILYFTDLILIEGPLGIAANGKKDFSVEQNFPNPANGITSMNYSLGKESDVYFNVTDIAGRIIYEKNFSKQSEGNHQVELNTADFSEGIYFYSFIINGEKVTRKFIAEN